MGQTVEPDHPAPVRIELTVKTALLAIASIAVVWLLLQIWQVLLTILVAWMFVGMLNPLVERVEKRGVRRSWAIAIVFVALFLLVGGFVALTLPSLATQVSDLFEHFVETRNKIAKQLEGSKLTAPLATSVRQLHLAELTAKAKDLGVSYGPKAIELVAYGASAFFLALYILIDRDRMRGSLFATVPRRYHVRLSRVLVNLEVIVGGYMRGQAITSAAMALFTFAVLMIAGVPNALALALFAGVADVLPYVGALLACGPATLAAASKGPTIAIIVFVVLAAYQEFESRVIIPRIYGRVLRLPAAYVMIALLVGGKLLGVLGALLSLPIAAAIRMLIEELRVALPGEEVPDSELRAKDAAGEAEFERRAAGLPAEQSAAIATEIAQARTEEDSRNDDAEAGTTTPLTSGLPSSRD